MNLVLRAKDVLRGLSPTLTDEFDSVLARINMLWAKEHNPQTGLHRMLHFDASTATQLTVGVAGPADPVPATPRGYLVMQIGGTEVLVPYYTKP